MSSCLKVKQRHGLMQQLIPARQKACQLHLRLNRQRPDFFQAGSKKESSVQKGRKHKFSRHSKPESKKTDRNEDASSSAPSFPSLPPPAKKKGRKTRSELIVIEEGDDIPAENEPMFGRVVWAQLSGQRTYHPAIVIKGSLVNLATPDIDHAFVFWFSDKKVSSVPREKLLDFVGFFKERAALCKSKQDKQGLQEAVEETHRQSEYGSYAVPSMDLIQWAWSGFPGLVNASSEALQPGQEVFCFPESISERLSAIGNEIRQKAAEKDRDIPNVFHSENALAAVREGRTEISDVCISCADMDRKVQCRHPLFEGGLCHMCQKDVKETVYAVGSDGSHSYCAVCAAGGELFVCDTPSCGRCKNPGSGLASYASHSSLTLTVC